MVPTLPAKALWILLGTGIALLSGWAVLRHGFAFSDYDLEASAAVARLLDGDLGGFLAAAPAYGGSLVLRAPLIAGTGALGGGEVAAYQVGALPALVALGVLAGLLAAGARERGWSRAAAALVVALAVLNPATTQALELGHPEELLGAVLCVAAALAALRGRWAAAGLLLGLAVANKPWAVVAVLPVLLALEAHRVRAGVLAAAVTALVLAPLALAGPGLAGTAAVATSAGELGKPLNVWWFTGATAADPAAAGVPAGTRRPPGWVSAASRPLLVLVAALAAGAWARRRRRLAADSALGLLALVLLVRCLLDPWTIPYYHLPLLLALLAWEVHRPGRRLPWATLATAGVLQAIVALRPALGSDALAAGYLALALPAAAALTVAVLGLRVRRRSAPASAPAPV